MQEDRVQELRNELMRRKALKDELASRFQSSMQNESPMQNEDMPLAKQIPLSALAGLGQMGHSLINAPHDIANIFSPSLAQHIPKQQEHNYAQMLGVPDTLSNKIIQGLAENSLAMIAPEAKLGQAGKLIEQIPKAGKFLEGAASRILPQAAIGGLTSENRAQGAGQAAAVQSLLEALPFVGKGIKGLAETFNPLKAAKEELGNIRSSYQASEAAKNEAYAPFNAISKDYKINNPKDYLETREENSLFFGPQIKRLDRKFDNDPTLENAHKLQSKMFTRMKQEYKKADPDYDKIEALEESRNSLNKHIINELNKFDKDIASKYKEGGRIHKEEVQPYFTNPKLATLVEGDVEDVTANDIINAIKPSKESKQIPKEHYLQEALKNMTRKQNIASAAQFGIPSLAGGVIGHIVNPSLGGVLGGLIGGGIGKFSTPRAAEFIQNPDVQKFLEKQSMRLRKYGQPVVRGLLNSIGKGS